jgi:hypothetical protein
VTREELLRLLGDDREIIDRLISLGVIEMDDDLRPEQAEACRVARTLVRDLEVNWPGVEIILRMRAELLATHRQISELLRMIRDHSMQ